MVIDGGYPRRLSRRSETVSGRKIGWPDRPPAATPRGTTSPPDDEETNIQRPTESHAAAQSVAPGWHLSLGARVTDGTVWPDERGIFQEIARTPSEDAPFAVRQVSRTTNRRGALRGLHFTDVPPGQAKFVTCVSGRILDVVVDVRVGSPTFGEHIAVELSGADGIGVYLAEGMAHGYLALEDETVVVYLHDAEYAPQHDRDLQALDTDLAIGWPVGHAIRSAKDRHAPTLAESLAAGALPRYGDRRDSAR